MAGVPDAAVGILLENIKGFVTYNASLIAGAEENFSSLCDQLEQMKDYARKCTEEYSDKDFLENLAKNVRKLVYRAEDAIETYIASVSRQKSRGVLAGALLAIDHALVLRNIGKELETIKQEMQQLYNSKVSLGFQAMQVDKGHQDQRVKKPPVDDDMVGLEDEMEKVMKLLNEGPEDLQAVSIVGMLGLGKTTLARKVSKHPTVEFQFFIRAFVEVSAEYKTNEIFLKILRNFTTVNEETSKMSEDDLAEKIRNYLAPKNFLIVLDDVWTPEAWDDLKRAFPINQKRSRILITTRNKPVAERASQGIQPHLLRFLRPDESRELLRKKVFGKDPFPSQLAQHETRILDRCDGLPLAIVVVAGILTNHRREGYWWERVATNVQTYNVAKTGQADYVIKLSFNNLPDRLKPCFLYLGVFREDFEIPSKTLLQLWVSEGFVPPSNGEESLEDVAEDYLEQLVDRGLVMVEKRRLNGRIKSVKLNDTFREFCKAQARQEELFREINKSKQDTSISPDEDRRLCINYGILEYINSKPIGKSVRSFLSFAKDDFILPLELISHIPKAFKLVRVLDIRSIKLIRFPSELYYLFLLKYIAMCSELMIIPDKVANLKFLQTLIVKTTQRALEMKADIWKMPQLRHFETSASASLVKSKEAFSINSNLQTLSKISPESCKEEVFGRAPLLKKLGICGTLAPVLEASGPGSLFDTLSKLHCLENLKLLNENTAVKLSSLPNESNFPSNLTRLTLQNTMLDWVHMSTLGKLRKLEILKLKENAFVGAYWETRSGGFQALRVLCIWSTDLTSWKASASDFPILTHIYLNRCAKLTAIPFHLVNISTLQLIDINCCNRDVATSARRLQMTKLQVQAQYKDNRITALKVSVYPPEH